VKFVVGLGNPGRKYDRTRHNLGFSVVDRLAADNEIAVNRELCDALVGEWATEQGPVLLVKPQTYMNRSGDAVAALLKKFHSPPEEIIVVYDDLDLPFGRIRIRPRGGAGGHRGLRSIIERTGGASFCRVRIGIGRPPEGVDPEEFVLERFQAEEYGELAEIVPRAAQAVCALLVDGAERAMERFNRVNLKDS
jgi:PTH1 family peptidyl-tRNA hydrolase